MVQPLQPRFASYTYTLRCTTGSVQPVNGINKDVSSARLLTTTVSTYPLDSICFCHLVKTQHCSLCPNGGYNPRPATTHPIHLTPCHSILHVILDISHCEKSRSKSSSVSQLAEVVIKHQLIINNYSSYTLNLVWLQPSTRDSQQVKYFKMVNSEKPNVQFGLASINPVTST